MLKHLSIVVPKESSMIFNFGGGPKKIISPRPRQSKQVCSIVSGLLFSFPEKFTQGPTRSY